MATTLPANGEIEGVGPRLPAVDRTLSLFELLSSSRKGLTLSELSRKLSIPISTTHYLISTLATRGYIHYCSDGRHYSLGIRLSDITDSSGAKCDLASLAMPFLREAGLRLNLATIVAVLQGAQCLIIGKTSCPNDQGRDLWDGRRIDVHCTALGKALIAHLPEDKLLELFRGRELTLFTPRTIPSFAVLCAQLTEVRRRGFAVNDDEHVPGTRAVAAPLFDINGAVVASVAIRGKTRDIPARNLEKLGLEIAQIADLISRELCGNRPTPRKRLFRSAAYSTHNMETR